MVDLWKGERGGVYLGGAHTRKEAVRWARIVADRTDQSITLAKPSGKIVATITPRGARNAHTRGTR